MNWTDTLLDGLAQFLEQLGAGTYDPDGDTGTIVLGALPDEITNGIGIQSYNLQPDPALADVVQPVQLWLRGDEQWVKATADVIFDGLHGIVDQIVAGINCPLIALHSDVQMGVDQRGRRERALNYDVSALRPTSSRTD